MNDNGWIPCSKELPSETDMYYATLLDSKTGRRHSDFCMFDRSKGEWGMNHYGNWHPCNSVIAWRPRLEPWDGELVDDEPAEWTMVDKGHGVCSRCHRQDSIDPLAKYCRYCGEKISLKK